jgi:glyoxylase-like metal-dependent hydrolase (beta-lactamase superfamily II)
VSVRRRLSSVLGNAQRLDGGAMFGNAPRAMWSRWIAPDDQNRIPLACRCLLVEEEAADGSTRRVLAETGIGAFFEPALKARYGVVSERDELQEGLAALGLTDADVDVVVLSHLHFDHAGGLLTPYEPGAPPRLRFPRARFVVGREAWERALHPHPRDRASFVPELQGLLTASGRLELVDGDRSDVLGPDYRLHTSHGHTPGLKLLEVPMPGGPVVFAGDLIPGAAWVHLPITMGYDRYPELLIDEKRALLTELVARGGRLFYTHDPEIACSRVARDERGKFHAVEPMTALDRVAD